MNLTFHTSTLHPLHLLFVAIELRLILGLIKGDKLGLLQLGLQSREDGRQAHHVRMHGHRGPGVAEAAWQRAQAAHRHRLAVAVAVSWREEAQGQVEMAEMEQGLTPVSHLKAAVPSGVRRMTAA